MALPYMKMGALAVRSKRTILCIAYVSFESRKEKNYEKKGDLVIAGGGTETDRRGTSRYDSSGYDMSVPAVGIDIHIYGSRCD